MFKLHMGNTPCQVSEEEWRQLGIKAEGYSGSDISIVIRDAMMQPVRKVRFCAATMWRPHCALPQLHWLALTFPLFPFLFLDRFKPLRISAKFVGLHATTPT